MACPICGETFRETFCTYGKIDWKYACGYSENSLCKEQVKKHNTWMKGSPNSMDEGLSIDTLVALLSQSMDRIAAKQFLGD